MNEIEKIEKFFKLDLKVKELIMKCKISNLDCDLESSMKAAKNLLETLEIIEDYLTNMIGFMNLPSRSIEIIQNKCLMCESLIINSNYDFNKLNNIYRRYFSNMDEELIDEVNNNIFGYNMSSLSNYLKILDKCQSMNEILHTIHSYVVNNENFYEKIPIIDSKKNEQGYPINYRGEKNELSEDIYMNFPLDMNCGWTNILSFNNEVLMMVRDRGHALTLEIKEENGKVWVNYFIPKICNAEKVNMLKGVTKVPEDAPVSASTRGVFVSEKDEFILEFYEFLKMIPTDMDMPRYNSSSRIA